MNDIYCPFRKEHVAAQPEEVVRQNLLGLMTEKLGYPKGCIVIEKALSQLPHLPVSLRKGAPDRRVDILVYRNHPEKGLVPLLLIECKAVPLKHAALQQVVGYNHYVGAPYVAIANADRLFMGWHEGVNRELRTIDFLPTYQELCRKSS